MKQTKGDLIKLFSEGYFDVIVHGCNCGNNMGDGIAKTIKEKFPIAYEVDCATSKFDLQKLGTYTKAKVPQGWIINAYTQYHWYGVGVHNGPLTEYPALRIIFRKLKMEFGNQKLRFGVPAIGCARAGGDWNKVSKIIDQELHEEDVTFVEFDGVDAARGNYKRNMR
tara:strand:+ start:45649 stop:46149 length:501 start_codon:yes stop_codon:yes gene_type:complete